MGHFFFATFKLFSVLNLIIMNVNIAIFRFNLFMVLDESVSRFLGQMGLAIWVCFGMRQGGELLAGNNWIGLLPQCPA